jgi:hypothetical protein
MILLKLDAKCLIPMAILLMVHHSSCWFDRFILYHGILLPWLIILVMMMYYIMNSSPSLELILLHFSKKESPHSNWNITQQLKITFSWRIMEELLTCCFCFKKFKTIMLIMMHYGTNPIYLTLSRCAIRQSRNSTCQYHPITSCQQCIIM